MKIQSTKKTLDQESNTGGVVVAIILAVIALLVSIGSFFFYMNLWNSDTASRTYPLKPGIVSKQDPLEVNTNTNVNTEITTDEVQLTSPVANTEVTSPIVVAGSAPGVWFFEGAFPITLIDLGGNELAHTQAQAVGDWMTTDQVEFTASIMYAATETVTAQLVFQPDNPSGLPNTTSFSLPIILSPTE